MDMIRRIVTTDNNLLTLPLPDNYVGKQVEVIAFVIDDTIADVAKAKKEVTFDAIKLDTRGFKFNRDEANER
jgi:hypothetical protein